jgi:hypothetical protein
MKKRLFSSKRLGWLVALGALKSLTPKEVLKALSPNRRDASNKAQQDKKRTKKGR